MNNKPIAYIDHVSGKPKLIDAYVIQTPVDIPLYTHPHPDNLGLAESIIKQQQLKIDNLYENNARLDAEIDELKTHPVKELTYEDGIEECAQRAEAYAYMSPNFIALAEELRAILRKARE